MKRLKTKIIVLISIVLIVVASITTIVFAVFTKTSTRGDIEVSANTLTASTSYTSKQEAYDWTYTKAGDTKEIEISTKNESDFILHRYYVIEKNANKTNDDNLLSAIMVYYNDKYIGQLIDVIENQIEIYGEYVFVEKTKTKTDSLKFELHQAASNSIFDSKNISINITTYTENANYLNNIFVSTEEEFKHAVDDINSGLFENIPKIVLCNTLSLNNSYTILNPACIYLNGSTLNGSLELNDTDALLEVLGDGTFNVDVTLTKYDSDKAKELVINNIKDKVKYGISSGDSIDILGHYAFYNHTISANATVTYTKPNVIAPSVSNTLYSKAGQITVAGEKISFKVKGSKTALLEDTLKHLPSNDSVLTTDLFLPTYIPSENAVITWLSSNEDILTSDGKIAARRIDSEEVSLYAEIKINDTVLTRTYTFKVSAHNNEINFYKLVQEISPIVINNIYSSSDDSDNALYHLPIVSQNNDGTFNNYDYRTSYESPVNTKLFNWSAYRDIGLENITYSMTPEEKQAYEYITLSDNELYLNTTTLNNYAKINITGDFGNDETYTTTIHVSIAVGTDTQLLEKAFTQISEELDTISVLGNILKTRKASGMKNEKGDFSLTSVYLENSDYTIEFSGESDIIPSIVKDLTEDKYNFSINPEYFNEYETTVAFSATVYYKKDSPQEKSKSRTFYVVVPAALHVKDFTTISIYNATKYQVFNQLRSFETGGETGYTKSGSTLTDSNLDYILLRDIVGDESYISEYKASNYYLEVAELTESTYALGVKTLNYNVNNTNDSNATDTAAYDFIKLIQWATSEGRESASNVVTNTSALGSLGSTKSNNEDYLNNDEIAVLKQYYMASTSSTEDEWNNLYKEVFNVAPGYIYTNPALLNTVISMLNNNSISWTSESYSTLFGKYMEILQRYAVSTTKVNKNDVAPCQEQYNSSYLWYHSDQAGLTSFQAVDSNGVTRTSNVDYYVQLKDGTYWYRGSRPANSPGRGGSDGDLGGYYATASFAADRTSYITPAEYQVIMMFWLNCSAKNLDTDTTDSNKTKVQTTLTQNLDYYSKYTVNDFNTVGKAIINAFDACMEIPTYFSTDGVAKIIKSFYEKKGYDLITYDKTTNTTPFKSSLNGDIPYITNADNIKSVLSYFINLEQLYINGSSKLSAFLSENGISTVFARTGLFNKKIERLTMKYSAHSNVNFDLTNIKNFANLKYLDLSNNKGIQSVNELVNVNRGNYIEVNIQNIGIDYEYQEFAIDNIATPTCTVSYTNELGESSTSNDNSRASKLADLSDFHKFISKYMYMTNVIYNDDGSTTTINWRVDEGNEITPVSNAGNYPSFSSIDEMNQFISPYYYCNQSFNYNGLSFEAGNYYRVYYEDSTLKQTLLGSCVSRSSLKDSDAISTFNIDTTVPDSSTFNNYQYTTTIVSTENSTIIPGNTTTYSTSYWYAQGNTNVYVTLTISNSYKLKLNGSFMGMEIIDWYNDVFYLNTTDDNNASKFFFVDYDTANKLYNKKYTNNITITGKTFDAITTANTYYMCLIYYDYLFFVGSTSDSAANDTRVSIVDDLSTALTIQYVSGKFTFSNGFNLRLNNSKQPIYHSQSDKTGISGTVQNNFTYSYNTSLSPYFTVHYKDGTETDYEAYAVGYRIYKTTNVTVEYTETETTNPLYYNNGNVYYIYYNGFNVSVTDESDNVVNIKPNTIIKLYANYKYVENSRIRTYRLSGTMYSWKLWYTTSNNKFNSFYYNNKDNQATFIDGKLIDSVVLNYGNGHMDEEATLPTLPKDSTTRSNNSEDWTTPLTSTWQYDKIIFLPYLSYVYGISQSSHTLLDQQADYYNKITTSTINHIFRYSGPTGTEIVYNGASASTTKGYNNSYGYRLVISNKQLAWTQHSTNISNPSGATLDSILNEANKHFNDYQYGKYYGMYYGYRGSDFYTALGNYYYKDKVYRLMPNVTNTAFEWVIASSFTTTTTSNMLLQLGTGVLKVGDICFGTGTAFSSFFTQGWYKVVLDEKTNIVNLVKFNDIEFTTNGASTYTRLANDKLVPRSGDYLGYSGTFNVQISALIRIKQADGSYIEYIKTYKMKFVGSLTS